MLLLSLAVAFAAVERPSLGAEGKVMKKVRAKGRLPNYYDQVVTDEQREKIYAIQEEYKAKIDPLEEQVKALKKEQDAKIAAVLSPEQKKKVDEAAVKAKEAAGVRAKEKAAESTEKATAPPVPAGTNPAK